MVENIWHYLSSSSLRKDYQCVWIKTWLGNCSRAPLSYWWHITCPSSNILKSHYPMTHGVTIIYFITYLNIIFCADSQVGEKKCKSLSCPKRDSVEVLPTWFVFRWFALEHLFYHPGRSRESLLLKNEYLVLHKTNLEMSNEKVIYAVYVLSKIDMFYEN